MHVRVEINWLRYNLKIHWQVFCAQVIVIGENVKFYDLVIIQF